ncbi:metal ABC transporter substrate-binding protein [Geodermatophilus sp. TF02-6]|uniref:metal ABC transporter substrate-binding protein n=1 Tax=Geodermatophilus sp. TF02-6 TaxID=2250575 RepID=UPI001F4893D1|nr:metal ABC transporter substrate-binding protein [Geodermatophilus sp. TF02-6]
MNRLTRSAVVVAAALLLAGCGGAGGPGGSGAGLTVVAGFYPLEWAAERVGGDRASVSSLTPPGAEAHDLELTPRDVVAVARSDLLVYLAGFQPALDQATDDEAADSAWDVGSAAGLIRTPGQHTGDDPVDPHFWLDPTRLATVGDALAGRLTELDPDGAATYEQNAAALRADLEALDGEMRAGLANCAVDTLVTSHEAFGYLADRYGFDMVGISGLSPSQEPDPEQLARIATLVREKGVTTVYTETLVDPAVAETVAAEAGARTAVLDPIEALSDSSPGDDYLSVMRANLATLQEGQSCS